MLLLFPKLSLYGYECYVSSIVAASDSNISSFNTVSKHVLKLITCKTQRCYSCRHVTLVTIHFGNDSSMLCDHAVKPYV
jgi:hypothetical protein